MDITTKVTGDSLTASEFMQVVTELETAIEDAGITLASGTLDQISKSMSNYSSGGAFYVDSGAADAYVCSPVGNKLGITAYADGSMISFIVGTTNTGASTVNVNGLGAKAIRDNAGYALTAGALEASDVVTVKFDNSNNYFRLIDSKFTRNPIGVRVLDTKHELTTRDFPDTTGLYGWHNNATGTWADEDWNGGEALTQIGAITTDTDIFGTASTFIDFDGANDALISAGTAFDAADESFTVGGWFKFDRNSTDEYLCAKWSSAVVADRSFRLWHGGGSDYSLEFRIQYNAGGNTEVVKTDNSLVTDNNWHHIIGIYDQSNNSIGLYVDGKCMGYSINANLANRKNGTSSELSFGGAYETTGSALTEPFDGNITEFFYKKTALTGNQIRKIYAAACQRFVTEETSNLRGSVISIHDGRKNNGEHFIYPTSTFSITATALGTAVTGYKAFFPEDGKYRVTTILNFSGLDTDATNRVLLFYARLAGGASGTTEIPGAYSFNQLYTTSAVSSSVANSNQTVIQKIIYAKKDDILNLEAWKSADTTTAEILYQSNGAEPYIGWEKLD